MSESLSLPSLNKPSHRSEVKGLSSSDHESAKLPLAIRESDVEYQLHRVVVFSRLLEGYPYTRGRVLDEALTDICPLYRGEIWAAILGVKVQRPLTYIQHIYYT